MTTGLWLYGPDKWRMTGIVATGDYTTAHAPRDGVDQLVDDIWDRHVHRRGMESPVGIEHVESETYDSYQQADLAARRWLDDHVC